MGFHLAEIISSIYRLAVSEKLKKELYDCYNARGVLYTFIQMGNNWEKMFALKSLSQLCLNKEILKRVRDDKELMNLVKTTNAKNANELVKKYSELIISKLIKLC